MADYYVDHGVYTSALGTTPTWGTPQEGDGSASTAAAASSVASIAFATVPTTGLMSVCGINIGTSGVIGAANVDAAANALAGLINAVTTAVASSVAVGVPQLRNLVYARGPSGGAPAGTCQIMMRVGSTTLNQATNALAAIASTFDGTPTLVQFVGGTGGCWGWLVNSAAIGVSSSIAAGQYGAMVNDPICRQATPAIGSFTYVRTGSGKTISMGNNVSVSRISSGYPMTFVFDTNTIWTGDSGVGVFTLNLYPFGAGIAFRPANFSDAAGVAIYCLAKGNFNVTTYSNAAGLNIGGGYSSTLFYQVKFSESAAPVGTLAATVSNFGTMRFWSCDFDFSTYTRANLSTGFNIQTLNGTATGTTEFDDCDFRFNLTGTPPDTYPLFNIAGQSSPLEILFTNNRVTTNTAYKLKLFTGTVAGVGGMLRLVFKNNSGVQLTSASIGIQTAAAYNRPTDQNSFVFIGDDTTRHQRYEHWNGVAEWNPSASPAQPTFSAIQPDGTSYSIKLSWLKTTAMANFTPFSYKSTVFNRLSTAVRTITQHLFFDSAIGVSERGLFIRVSYVDNNGVARTESSFMKAGSIVTSGVTWAGAGSYSGYVAYKIAVTTAYQVKTLTEVSVDVVLQGQPPGATNADVYLDPEPVIA